jgi:hypothetical protein
LFKIVGMKGFAKKYVFEIIFTSAGAIAGFLYWKFVGCISGTCVIKSVWYLSSIYGMLLGYLTGDIVISIYNKIKLKENNNEKF